MLQYAITDRIRLAASETARREALLQQARQCAAAGVDFLQLREKDLAARELAELARSILGILHGDGITGRLRLLLNSRADIAVAVAADGVHLTSSPGELTPAQVRDLFAWAGLPRPVTSISCHSTAEVRRARELEPSLILFGPVFEKVIAMPRDEHAAQTVVSSGTGLELLRAACVAAGPVPVLALGGVTRSTTQECLQAGAAGVAGIRLFTST